jgi:hypothetical protein
VKPTGPFTVAEAGVPGAVLVAGVQVERGRGPVSLAVAARAWEQADQPAHPAICVHHRRPGCRRSAARRAGSRLARRSADHGAIRPSPRLPRPVSSLPTSPAPPDKTSGNAPLPASRRVMQLPHASMAVLQPSFGAVGGRGARRALPLANDLVLAGQGASGQHARRTPRYGRNLARSLMGEPSLISASART